jgi:hypothetical protein
MSGAFQQLALEIEYNILASGLLVRVVDKQYFHGFVCVYSLRS